jgi:hypothetical protein
MSTDIDALIAEATDFFSNEHLFLTPGDQLAIRLLDALTTERARLVELEAFRNGYKNYIRKLQDSAEAERAKVAAMEAEVARWREVAGELAGAMQDTLCDADGRVVMIGSDGDREVIRAALARFKQGSGK